MDFGEEFETDCCGCPPEAAEISYGCAERKLVFTKREQEVLGKIREASLLARTIKDMISRLPSESSERRQAEHELQQLRAVRNELERERVAAAEERMRILGHV